MQQASAAQQAGPPATPPGVDRGQLQQLEAMGFPHQRIVRALLATQSSGDSLLIAEARLPALQNWGWLRPQLCTFTGLA